MKIASLMVNDNGNGDDPLILPVGLVGSFRYHTARMAVVEMPTGFAVWGPQTKIGSSQKRYLPSKFKPSSIVVGKSGAIQWTQI